MLLAVAPALFAQQGTPKTAPKALTKSATPLATKVGQTIDGTLSLANIDGKKVTLKDLLGEVTVLNFFSIEAKSQHAANARFVAMQREFDGKARFVHINSNAREIGLRPPKFAQKPEGKRAGDEKAMPKPYGRMRKHLEAKKLPFEVFVDHRNRIADALGAMTTPHVLILDASGKLIYRGLADDKFGAGAIRDEESTVAWFYRVLRNAVVDRHRRRAREPRSLGEASDQVASPLDSGLEKEACECIEALVPLLNADYAELIRRVDLDGESIGEIATERGVSSGSARVRLHRARAALRREVERTCRTCAEHGCLDCTCSSTGNS